MPSLPQTKECTLCPAKFTRTTHLNRHIRSHTNERQHQCDICQAQFTRSDLLTRHKRTCGDVNVYKSRRKSCTACAESKIKCDLESPCSKCTSRGRECLYVNDPEASKAKKLAAARKASRTTSEAEDTKLGDKRARDDATVLPFRELVPTRDRSHSMSSSLDPPSTSAESSASSSSAASPFPDVLENYSNLSPSSPVISGGDVTSSIADLTFDARLISNASSQQLNSPFRSPSFDPQLCSIQRSALTGFPPEQLAWIESGEMDFSQSLGNNDFSLTTNNFSMLATTDFPMATDPGAILPADMTFNFDTIASAADKSSDHTPLNSQALTDIKEPPEAELQHYLYLFFSAFSPHIPLIHVPTWRMEGKPSVLVQAMQACGALFVKTPTAQKFIIETLGITRDILMLEFAKTPTDSPEYLFLILAVILLQSIGLFHQNPEIRSSSTVYHGMLVMMIRRTGLINRIATWKAPDLSTPSAQVEGWHEWCAYETAKRALIFAYLHDCFHCVFFAIAPSLRPCEFDISLPCDNVLWCAPSCSEWLKLLRSSPSANDSSPLPSIGGTSFLAGLDYLARDFPNTTVPLPTSLASAAALPSPPALNPFGHFILVHSILRNLYECRIGGCILQPSSNTKSSSSDAPDMTVATETEHALRNWLHAWLSYDSMHTIVTPSQENMPEPPFASNGMPFFWLSQVSLLAVREGNGSLLAAKARGAIADERFRLVRRWLACIRVLMRKGDGIGGRKRRGHGHLAAEEIWDQLMSVRAQVTTMAEGESQHPLETDGLLVFFAGL